jgi:putative ABC transport system permease protein
VLGIGLGISVLAAVSLLNRSILTSIDQTVQGLAGKADLLVQGGSSGFDESLFDVVRSTPGVQAATRVIEQVVRVQMHDQQDERVMVLGIDLLNQQDRYFRSYEGGNLEAVFRDPIAFLNAPNHMILSRTLAKRLGNPRNQPIWVRTAQGKRPFESWGVFDDPQLGQAFSGSIAIMDYVAMQVAFDRGRNIDRIDVAVADGADPARVAERINARLGDGFFVGKPHNRGERAAKLMSALTSGLSMASLVAVLVGMFLIYSTVAISITQRRHEIAVLRALGMTRAQIMALFTLEGALLGCLGGALGVLIGLALSQLALGSVEKTVNELFAQVAVTRIKVELVLLLTCFLTGVVASAAAALLAATAAARVAPSEALQAGRHLGRASARHALWLDVAALLALLASLLLLVAPLGRLALLASAVACATIVAGHALIMPRFVLSLSRVANFALRRFAGVDLRLGSDGLVRELGRSSATASALMVGVAMSLSFSSLADSFIASTLTWVDQMLPADLWITSAARMAGGSSVAMTDALGGELAQLHGVQFVERVRMVDVDVLLARGAARFDLADARAKLISMDTEVLGTRAHLMMIDGSENDAKERLRAGEALISENLGQRLHLRRGDTLSLATAFGRRQFRVAGVIVEYTSDQGSILLDRETYVTAWADRNVDSYKLYLGPGVQLEPVRRTIYTRWGDRFQLTVLTHREFRAQIRELLGQTFGLMRGLELVAIVISILSVVNAVFANVLDRGREYGVLRAVGMLRGQLRRMILTEAILVAVSGAFAGVLAGLAIGYVLLAHLNVAQTGWHLPYQPTLSSALVAAAPVVLAAAAAAYYPARIAAARAICNALAYE